MTTSQKNAKQAYPIKVDQKLKENHKHGDETAILRKAIKKLYELTKKTPSDEFMAYYNEAEGIKAEVKAALQMETEEAET